MPDTDKQLHTGEPVTNKLLMIDAQYTWHDEVRIIGTKEAVKRLGETFIQASELPSVGIIADREFYPPDGEGYLLEFKILQEPEYWKEKANHYTQDLSLAGLNPDRVAELVAASEEMLKQASHFMFANNPQYKALKTALANVKGGV